MVTAYHTKAPHIYRSNGHIYHLIGCWKSKPEAKFYADSHRIIKGYSVRVLKRKGSWCLYRGPKLKRKRR